MAEQQWSADKIAASVVAMFLFLFGSLCFYGFYHFDAHSDGENREEAFFGFEVDLSKPGVYSGKVPEEEWRHGCRDLVLRTQPSFESEEDAKIALVGLLGQVTIVGRTGDIGYDKPLGFESVRPACRANYEDRWGLAIDKYGCFASAGDTVTVTVLQGASRLSGMTQSLVVEHFGDSGHCGGQGFDMVLWLMGAACYVGVGIFFSQVIMEGSRWPWGRILLVIAGLYFLKIAAVCFYDGFQSQRKADRAMAAEPLRLEVDLSKPGEYRGEFKSMFYRGVESTLKTQPPFASMEAAKAALKGFSGNLAIYFPNGRTVCNERLDADTFFEHCATEGPAFTPTVSFWGRYYDGDVYRVRLKIEKGAEGLAGVRQAFVTGYNARAVYGDSQAMYAVGIWPGVIAGLIFFGVFIVTMVKRRRIARSGTPCPTETVAASQDKA